MQECLDKQIEETLHQKTGFDTDTIGCFLANYKERHVCPVALNGWCKELMKCKVLESIIK